MPLRSLINQSMLSPEDADLLESLFNQFYAADEDTETRHERAGGLVSMFANGERDQAKLIGYLLSAGPDEPDDISGASPD